jgi:hypothetical protein
MHGSLATQEAEIKRIVVKYQSGQTVCETLSRKNPSQKRAGEVAQGVALSSKPSTAQNQTKPKKHILYLTLTKNETLIHIILKSSYA